MPQLTLQQLSEITGAEMHGDPNTLVSGVNSLQDAQPGQLSFLNSRKHVQFLASTQASVVILSAQNQQDCPCAALLTDNPYLVYARAAAALTAEPLPDAGIHPSAVVHPSAQVADSAIVGPHCTVLEGARIGERVHLVAGCFVGKSAEIGDDTRVLSNASILDACRIGQRCLLHPSSVIGSDGFGLANDQGAWIKVPQLGRVIVGNDVEVGASSTIDRGAIGDTVIDDGVKLDNQIHLAHNTKVGAHTAMAAGVGIAGSTEIGAYCTLAGQAGVSGHLKIGDRVNISAQTGVTRDLPDPGVYTSTVPAIPHAQWRRNFARIKHLDDLAKRIAALEKALAEKEKSEQDVT